MNRLTIDLTALHHNMKTIDAWISSHGAKWTLVTKSLCGYNDVLMGLFRLGARSIGDSRLENLELMQPAISDIESWYLRPPSLSDVEKVVSLADVSLVTETLVIERLNEEAARQGKIHRIVIMIELGDLREGILPGSLVGFYSRVFELPNIDVIGIGANIGCLSGSVPTVDQYMQLLLYHELLELKFGRTLPIISAGTSATLPLLRDGQLPKGINHFRIGESVFLGSDLIHGGVLPGLRDDVVTIEAEVLEIKEKSLVPAGELNADTAPFDAGPATNQDISPGQRGYRALVSLGQLDTDVFGLTPVNPNFQLAGASSDITVLNVGERPGSLRLGDMVAFRPNYAAFVRVMSDPYVVKHTDPALDQVAADLDIAVRRVIPVGASTLIES